MAGFSESFKGVSQQMRQMTRSQQIALLLGAALVAGSLAWMVQWAATPEMVPLLTESLSNEDLSEVTAGLDAMNQKYKIVGSQVFVPQAADRSQLVAKLQQADKMPSDFSMSFATLVQQSNPWLSQSENNRRWTLAMQEELAGVLSKFSEVESARVFLNLTAPRQGFSRYQPNNSASVTLTMRGGAPVSRTLAMSAARLVAGAVRGMSAKQVQVVDSLGRSAIEWEEEESDGASSLARRQRDEEKQRAEAIRKQLDYIPGIRVNVQVVLSHTAKQSASSEVAEGAPIQTRTHEETSGQRAATGQPGVQPNTGETVSAGAEGDFRTMTEREDTLEPSVTKTTESTPAGQIQEVYASIAVSHEYLASIWQRSNTKATEPPTEAQIDEQFTKLRERISRQVTKLVYPPRAEQIAVEWYFESGDAVAAAQADSGSGAMDASLSLATKYAPAGILGVLALASLFVMFRMARQSPSGEAFGLEIGMSKDALEAAKRVQRDVNAGNRRAEVQKQAEATAAAIPLGSATEPMLEAQEVDEKMVQVNQMLAQVASFVKQDEHGIAALVERWVDNR